MATTGRLLRETNPTPGRDPGFIPQHGDGNGGYVTTDTNNPLPVQMPGVTVEEQLTDADASSGTLTFSANLSAIGIYNTDKTNTGVFTVNGIAIHVPPNTPFEGFIGGTPGTTVAVTGATSYIVTRYV